MGFQWAYRVVIVTLHYVSKSAAFFDLDKTIISRSSLLAFAKPFNQAGLISRKQMVKNFVDQYFFSNSGANHAQMEKMRQTLTSMVAGWDVEQTKSVISESLRTTIHPMIYDEAADLIERHIRDGRDVILVSTSGREIVEPIGKMLGAKDVIATEMEIVEGKYTGKVAYYAYAEKKAEAVRAIAERDGYDLQKSFAYSDSSTDIPLLSIVGFPCAVNPDRSLRAHAESNNWPILHFTRPVPLKQRFAAIPPKPALAAAVGLGALSTIIYFFNRRKKTAGGSTNNVT
jgi:HAD superfamily hydrolase (TIGR01490 family)